MTASNWTPAAVITIHVAALPVLMWDGRHRRGGEENGHHGQAQQSERWPVTGNRPPNRATKSDTQQITP